MAAADIDEYQVARQLFRDQPERFPFEGFDVEELILPDGEDFGIKSDDDDDEEEELETETGFGSVIGACDVLQYGHRHAVNGKVLTCCHVVLQWWIACLWCQRTSMRNWQTC